MYLQHAKLVSMNFEWEEIKNEKLKRERNLCFEDVVLAAVEDRILANIEHHNKQKYPNQRILVMKIENYIYLVPCIFKDKRIFLKTIYPSRVATKLFLKESYEKN